MKKVKVLALIMVFALAALGGAYAALWSDTVTMQTNVATGNVDIKWGPVGATDKSIVGDDYHGDNAAQLKDGEDSVAAKLEGGANNPNADNLPIAPGMRRNVGHIAVNPVSTENNLVVDITNAYPDYQGEIEATIINAGSVPVILNKVTATMADGSPIPNWLNYNVSILNSAVNSQNPIPVQNAPLVGTVLEASNTARHNNGAIGSKHDTKDTDANWGTLDNKVRVKVSVHVAGGTGITVPQDANASIKLSIEGTQWNGVDAQGAIVNNSMPTLNLPNGIVARFD